MEHVNPANKVIERITEIHLTQKEIKEPLRWGTALIIEELSYCLLHPEESTAREMNQMREGLKVTENKGGYLLKKSILRIARGICKGSYKDEMFLKQSQALQFLASKLV